MQMEMQHKMLGYDRAATMFAPDGRLLQVEYAEKTVRLGSASIGMVCSDGVLIVADKRVVDPLFTQEAGAKIWQVDSHLIASAAGILSDARVLLEHAQVIAQQHRVTYDQPIDVESIIRDIANLQQSATQFAGARPFGIEIMTAGVNKDKSCKLYVSEVTGNYASYNTTAIGENDEQIKEELRKLKGPLQIEKGIKLALGIFKKVLGKQFRLERFEVAYVPKELPETKRLYGKELVKFLK